MPDPLNTAGNAGTTELTPTIAYKQAIESPVYRLSELMFGSLLAAYVLGFINSPSFQVPTGPDLRTLDGVSQIFVKMFLTTTYLFISLSYAYITAAFYLSYHAGILTMPTLPLNRLRYDFALALSTAVAFGYSIRYPKAFPALLGATLLSAAFRQNVEYREFTKNLFHAYLTRQSAPKMSRDGTPVLNERSFRKKLVPLLQAETELRSWKGPQLWFVATVAVLMAASITQWYLEPLWKLGAQVVVAIETLVIALAVFWQAHGILRHRANFLYDRHLPKTKMDAQLETFKSALNTL